MEDEKLIQLKADMEAAQAEAKKAREELAEVKKNAEAKEAEMQEKFENLDKTIEEMDTQMKSIKVKASGNGVSAALDALFASSEFKAGLEKVQAKKEKSVIFEVKVDTSAMTGTVGRSLYDPNIDAAAQLPRALYDRVAKRGIPAGKSNIVWVEASFTDNTDYVDEGADNSNKNTGSAEEKTRGLAKIQCDLPFTEEMMTDLPELLNYLKNESIVAIRNKVDTELISGEGADTSSTTKKKIYGVIGQGSTAFSASTAGFDHNVDHADFFALLLAVKSQAEAASNQALTVTDIHYNLADAYRFANMRDANGNAISVDYIKRVLGLNLVPNNKITAGTLIGVSAGTIELFEKRSFEIEIERVASTDSYVMYVRWRGQSVVKANKKVANIYVSDIDTAIAAIQKPAAPQLKMTNVGVSALAATSATIGWQSAGTGIKYKYSSDNINWSDEQSGTSVSLTGLTASTTYTYYVKAVKSGQMDSESKSVTFTTPAA